MTVAVAPSSAPSPRSLKRELNELLSSMRFAITLLTVICIASAIGTVVKQGEPFVNYVDQFGPLWAEVFGAIGLYRIYSTPWFLVILAFLVISTSLCIARNTPKILTDLRTFKEHVRSKGLEAFPHKASGRLGQSLAQSQEKVLQLLGQQGWQIKTEQRTEAVNGEAGLMVAARLGRANKLGYIAAHSAIVLVCLGGLFDGEMIVNVQAWAQNLKPFKGADTVPEDGRLSEANPAYRASLYVPEGLRNNNAVINLEKGMLVQPLPFEVELRKFKVDYYETGMPKRFASDIVIHDPREKEPKAFTVEVNHPVQYQGVTIFQSSFQDGGSLVHLRPHNLWARDAQEQPLFDAIVGGKPRPLPMTGPNGQQMSLNLEVTDLRVINVENMAAAKKKAEKADGKSADAADSGDGSTDVRGVNLETLTKHLGSGAKPAGDKQMVNVGPSITYKLRDQAGQAREYQNYMAPIHLNGQTVFLLGVRDSPNEGFRYLRVPADENMSLQGWIRLRHALNDADLRIEAARRFGKMAAPADRPELQEQLSLSAQRSLDLFAGAVQLQGQDMQTPSGMPLGGLAALSAFIEQVVPPEQRENTSATLIRILNGAMFQLWNLSRERAGLPPSSPEDQGVLDFMTQAVLTMSDAAFYPAPILFTLDSFDQKLASVFQVTRTPGRNIVYLGCALLIIGVFAMLYIRERRLWIWLQEDGQGGTNVKMALSSTRQTLDTDREFDRLREAVLGPQAPAAH
ncbi:MAG: cytochrome c biogenesis protein ResB [Aquabacterium sp.]